MPTGEELNERGWLTLSTGRRACVGKPARRFSGPRSLRRLDGAQGFFVLGPRTDTDTIAPIVAHGIVVRQRVQLSAGELTFLEALELARAAAELAQRSEDLLREAQRGS